MKALNINRFLLHQLKGDFFWPPLNLTTSKALCSRVFQLWKDVSDHICQLGNYVVHNFQLDAKKFEFRKGNPFPAIFLKIIKGKHGFYNGRKIDNFEKPFLVRKMYQYWSRIYQKMRNSNIWGGYVF